MSLVSVVEVIINFDWVLKINSVLSLKFKRKTMKKSTEFVYQFLLAN